MAFETLMSAIFLLFAAAVGASEVQTALPPGLGAELPDNGHKCQPTKIHLALGAAEDEIRVSWATKGAGCTSKVHFGLVGDDNGDGFNSSNVWPSEFVADLVVSDSYGPDDFCAEPASKDDFDPPNLHSTVMTGLIPGQLYYYQIGHHMPIRHFKAPPTVGPDTSFRFIAYADVGESVHKGAKSPGAHLTMAQVEKEVDNGAELLLHIGDLSYADGRHKIWDTFMELIEPYASRVPYQIAVGNHEYDWKTGLEKKHKHHTKDASGRDDPYDPNWGNYGNDSGGECGVPVSKLFTMSDCSSNSNGGHPHNAPFWFSYDYGSVHFTTISTEHDLSSGSDQRKWLEHDLASVDRCRTPWVVLLSHRPMYVVHPHKSNRVVGEHLRKFLEPVLEEHKVDIVLSGHVHAYARTCNVYEHKCVSESFGGTTHVTLGCGGRKLSSVEHDQPKWLDYAEQEFGFGRITVHGSHKLLLEYVRSDDGKVLDSRVLHVSHSATKGCGLSSEAPELLEGGLLQGGNEGSGSAYLISAVQHVGDFAASLEDSALSAAVEKAGVVADWVSHAWRMTVAAIQNRGQRLTNAVASSRRCF